MNTSAYVAHTDRLIEHRIDLEQSKAALRDAESALAEALGYLGVPVASPSEERVRELREELALVQAAIEVASAQRVVAFSLIDLRDKDSIRRFGRAVRSEGEMRYLLKSRRQSLYANIKSKLESSLTSEAGEASQIQTPIEVTSE